MIRELEDQHNLEKNELAPYATHNLGTRGRRYPEKVHPFRTDFQRDRDRILHSHAFRRLEYKTQVFLSGRGDHYWTRLTHTIEVAAIARTIARSLNLNEDLTETISLAHDLGHTPALRIVDELEIKYPEYDGINLTWEVRAGLIKHRIDHAGKRAELDGCVLPCMPSLEAQVADVADDLTYYGHDVDDGLDSGLITPEMMEEVELWRMVSAKAAALGLKKGEERFAAFSVRCLIDAMVGDVIRSSNAKIERLAPESAEEVGNLKEKLISFSDRFESLTKELRDFLYHNLYFHPELKKLNELSFNRMDHMFRIYLEHPEFMGETAQSRIGKDGVARAAADYIAGMTDRFAENEYRRLTGERREG